jgi:hypothetical protein
MYNNGRQRKEKQFVKPRKFTYRHVVAHEMKQELEEEVRTLSGSIPGTPEYFAKYQAGLKVLCESLDDDELEQYMKMAKEWNERMPPKEIQRAYVQRKRLSYIN